MKKNRLVLSVLGLVSIISMTFFAAACADAGKRSAAKIRIAVATFSHETCTFCPDPTTIEDWEYSGPPTSKNWVLLMGYIWLFTGLWP